MRGSGHCWLFGGGARLQHLGSGQDLPTGGLQTDFRAPWSASVLVPGLSGSSSAYAVCPGLGLLWALPAPGSTPRTGRLLITRHATCRLGVSSTLDSVSPPRDSFKRCLEECAGSSWVPVSQQHVAKDTTVS